MATAIALVLRTKKSATLAGCISVGKCLMMKDGFFFHAIFGAN